MQFSLALLALTASLATVNGRALQSTQTDTKSTTGGGKQPAGNQAGIEASIPEGGETVGEAASGGTCTVIQGEDPKCS